MVRLLSITLLIVSLLAPNSFAGISKGYGYPLSSDLSVAPIKISGKGIYNLVISINLLQRPQDRKIYRTDAYREALNRLQVEWSGIALQKILEAQEVSIEDLPKLKKTIESEIINLANNIKQKYSLEESVELVFSISNFFLLEPKVK